MKSHFNKNSITWIMLQHIANHLKFPMNLICNSLWFFQPIIKYIFLSKPTTAAFLRTTTTITKFQGGSKINTLPAQASAIIHHRVHPSDTLESVLSHDYDVIGNEKI